jgi:hypothetical protein
MKYNVYLKSEIQHNVDTFHISEIHRVYNYRVLRLTSVYLTMMFLSNKGMWNEV